MFRERRPTCPNPSEGLETLTHVHTGASKMARNKDNKLWNQRLFGDIWYISAAVLRHKEEASSYKNETCWKCSQWAFIMTITNILRTCISSHTPANEPQQKETELKAKLYRQSVLPDWEAGWLGLQTETTVGGGQRCLMMRLWPIYNIWLTKKP